MEFDNFGFKKIDKEAQQTYLDKYVCKWFKRSKKDNDGEWVVDIVRIVGVFTVDEELQLTYQHPDGYISWIPVKEIEEQENPEEIYFTMLDDEMAKSELANL